MFLVSENHSFILQDILNDLQRVLNFTVTKRKPYDKQWGLLENDGKWNGMIRELIDGDIDIVSAGLAISLERALVVDYRYII